MSVILTRAPLRVSLGGGGTDLPSYYREHGGFVVSAAIDRYVYMLTSTAFQDRFRLKHMEWEEVDDPGQIKHPILREVLTRHWNGRPLELASVSDVPAGTGLGSSGAYTVCVLKAIRLAAGRDAEPGELAEDACHIEIEALERTIGKQDQYASAHGGLRAYTFNPDDTVGVRPLDVPDAVQDALRQRFLLFFTGGTRSASDILADQVTRTLSGDAELERTLHRAKEVALAMGAALESGDLPRCAELMNEQWEIKRARAAGAITEQLDELRNLALESGGSGAILIGAGGGGFLLVYSDDPERTRVALSGAGAHELDFGVDAEGCTRL